MPFANGPGQWVTSQDAKPSPYISTEAAARKATPVYSGFVKYFPRAMREVARVSYIGNEQHNPGSPLHWDRSKSKDEPDAMMRHLIDHVLGEEIDTDECLHLAKVAWRAMANLEKYLEENET
jgi:hypothetical protein